MLKLLNCPICSNPADWSIVDKITKIEVFFCIDCLEHFTAEDTVTTIIKKSMLSSNIIDDIFIDEYFKKNSKND